MKLVVKNKEEIDDWLFEHAARDGHLCRAIKSFPPNGCEYDSGGVVIAPVNIGWEDTNTGERIAITYMEVE